MSECCCVRIECRNFNLCDNKTLSEDNTGKAITIDFDRVTTPTHAPTDVRRKCGEQK